MRRTYSANQEDYGRLVGRMAVELQAEARGSVRELLSQFGSSNREIATAMGYEPGTTAYRSAMRSLQRYQADEGKQQRLPGGEMRQRIVELARQLGIEVDPATLKRRERVPVQRVTVTFRGEIQVSSDIRQRSISLEVDSEIGSVDPLNAFLSGMSEVTGQGLSAADVDDWSLYIEVDQ